MNATCRGGKPAAKLLPHRLKASLVVDVVYGAEEIERLYQERTEDRRILRIRQADEEAAVAFVNFENLARPKRGFLHGRLLEVGHVDAAVAIVGDGVGPKSHRPFPGPIELDGASNVDGEDRASVSFGDDAHFPATQPLPLRAISELLPHCRLGVGEEGLVGRWKTKLDRKACKPKLSYIWAVGIFNSIHFHEASLHSGGPTLRHHPPATNVDSMKNAPEFVRSGAWHCWRGGWTVWPFGLTLERPAENADGDNVLGRQRSTLRITLGAAR